MEWQPLEMHEKLRLRSRLLVSLALLLTMATGAALCAIQITISDQQYRFVWMGVLIVCLAFVLGSVRLVIRLGGDIRKGEKQVIKGKIELVKPQGRKIYVKINDAGYQLPGFWAEHLKKGERIELSLSKSKILLGVMRE